jgi:hypothetical protein
MGRDVWDSVGAVGGMVAGGIVGSVFLPSIGAWLISDWISAQLAEDPGRILLFCALAFASGAGLACSIAVPLFKLKEARMKAEKAKLEDAMSGLEDDKADLSGKLAFAEANAKSVLAQDDEDLALVMLRQDFLSGLASIDSAERRQEYVVERLTGSVEDNERFGAAFRDLEKYGCVGGSKTIYMQKNGFSTAFSPGGPTILRTDYPSLRERERRDIVIEARDEAIREFERKSAERRRREMM